MSLDALPVQETAEKLKLPTPEELYRYLDDLRRSCGGERVQFTGSNGNAGKTVTVNIDQRFFPIGRVLAHDTPLAFCGLMYFLVWLERGRKELVNNLQFS